MKKIMPGFALTVIVAVAADLLNNYFSALGSVTLAIVIGLIVGNAFVKNDICKAGIDFAEKTILTTAIMLMGFKLQFDNLSSLGWLPFVVIIPAMIITITTSVILGRLFGYSASFATMMGVGNAVCGSSAIAAVAPSLRTDEKDLGIAVSIVNLLGACGIFILPFIAGLMHYDNTHSSYLIGGVLQAVGHVVAGGYSINDSVGETATLIKMLRVLMIGPAAVIVAMVFNYRADGSRKTKKFFVPPYIIGFVLCSIAATIMSSDNVVLPKINSFAKFLLMIAMAGVGMKISFASLLRQGPKALIFGIAIFAVQILFMLSLLYFI